nr:hypothetical protein [Tanacetum cinerariifolium]
KEGQVVVVSVRLPWWFGVGDGVACGDEMVVDGGGNEVVMMELRWRWQRGEGGSRLRWPWWLRWWRVMESGVKDRVDRVTRNIIFGVLQKSSSENFSGCGGWPEVVVAGRRPASEEGERKPSVCV